MAQAIEDSVNPPKFFVSFSPPVEVSGGVNVRDLVTGKELRVQQGNARDPVFAVLAGPGTYHLQLRGAGEKAGHELLDDMEITKTNQFWKVDTSERFWVKLDKQNLNLRGFSPLSTDFEIVATVKDPVLRSILVTALGEVGVYERGTDWEQRRIASYWTTLGVKPFEIWSLAFVAWVLARADIQSPDNGALLASSWLKWGDEVPGAEPLPGAIALFRGPQYERYGPRVGIVLQKRQDCIEVIVGDSAGRVAIRCEKSDKLVGIRQPHTKAVSEAAKTSE